MTRLQTRLTVEPAVLREGCRHESEIATQPPHKKVVLTFDDGPEPGQTEHILTVLAPLSSLKLFRYPYGNSSCETNALLRNMGYKIVGWHVDTCDWAFDHDGSVDDKEALSCGVLVPFRKDFVGHVLASARAHNGGIVLMHEIHPNTLKKLDDIIMRLKEEGFSFAPLTDEGFANSMR